MLVIAEVLKVAQALGRYVHEQSYGSSDHKRDAAEANVAATLQEVTGSVPATVDYHSVLAGLTASGSSFTQEQVKAVFAVGVADGSLKSARADLQNVIKMGGTHQILTAGDAQLAEAVVRNQAVLAGLTGMPMELHAIIQQATKKV